MTRGGPLANARTFRYALTTLDAVWVTMAISSPFTLRFLLLATTALPMAACASGVIGDASPTDAGPRDKPDTAIPSNNRGPDNNGADDAGDDRDVSADVPEDDTGPSGSVNNGVVVSCLADETRFCTTPCGTQGLQRCEGVSFGPCEPPVEDCDGIDQDCDGEVDEGVGQRSCSSSCGGGVESCNGGRWSGCTAANPQVETCNNEDDDCDSRVDEDLTRPCNTTCGSGTETCVRGQWVGCTAQTPLPESCNNQDDDCNGSVDDDVVRGCQSACGGGVERCQRGQWGACDAPAPQPELCDRDDNDCDGAVDEELSRACSTACGSGTETCNAGRWQACTARQPVAESCNNQDDDCDGAIDNGLNRACSTACGNGAERCMNGQWQACTAPQPVAETCNDRDDDCDGSIDEGHQVQPTTATFAQLTAAQPPCTFLDGGIDTCLTAAHRWCASSAGCLRSGAGIISPNFNSASVTCLGKSVTVMTVSLTDVYNATQIDLDGHMHQRVAWSASNRYCRSQGYAGGIGPVEHSGFNMTVTCVPSSIGETVQFSNNDAWALGCDIDNTDTQSCADAANTLCRNAGWEHGHGPVEWNLAVVHVLCLKD